MSRKRARVCVVGPEVAAAARRVVALEAPPGWTAAAQRDRLAGRIAALAAYTGRRRRGVRVVSTTWGAPAYSDGERLEVSVAHSAGWGAAICAARPVGIDVEPVRAVGAAVVERALPPAEAAWIRSRPAAERALAFLALWTVKEAAAKVGGLRASPCQISVRAAWGGRVLLRAPDCDVAAFCRYAPAENLVLAAAWLPGDLDADLFEVRRWGRAGPVLAPLSEVADPLARFAADGVDGREGERAC